MSKYNESMSIIKQLRTCPNAFRVDLYKGCDFGCRYCFANCSWFKKDDDDFKQASIEKIKKKFEIAFDTQKESKDVIIELLRHRVPLHCGGMSDPFQSREEKYHLTHQLIEISNHYSYPVQFSTKTDFLSSETWNILNSELHAFQSSIIGWDYSYIRTWESNTPPAIDRLKFGRQLKRKGFWWMIRMQPVIEIEQALKLLEQAKDIPDYVNIEHLRLNYANKEAFTYFVDHCNNKQDFEFDVSELHMRKDKEIENVKKVQKLCNSYGVQVGASDTDTHYLTQGRNCCGLDRINDNFDAYLKYNATYMMTGPFNAEELWCPQCNMRKHIHDEGKGKEIYFKAYVKDFIRKNPDCIGGPYKGEIERQLFGKSQRRLF